MSHFSRRQILQILTGVALLANPFIAEAAQVPTLKCTRVGQTIIWRDKKYTCVKSGNKLVWNKGVPVTPAKPTPSATTQPSTQPTPTTSTAPHPAYTPPPDEFAVAKSANLKLNQPISVSNPSLNYPARGYILIRREDGVIAFSNRCTHLGRDVEISGSQLVCFAHGSYFEATTGKPTGGPATRNLILLPTIERDGTIFVVDAP
ncbi:Reiske domain-containing protein [Candidatus Planktophila versatilis]|uniref:Reiske domain-containing protein n=1 Tax=Candidatus Planktophila versatilis TaxID=1884905 RepID=A0AAC9YX04_9ACTN|nr:Rieske (2Fe-2S) protein [Candidatus Planktophila versatilis]ASY23174.1 Reiske domain-containing protein [Candidatus Planktophila versatilis]